MNNKKLKNMKTKSFKKHLEKVLNKNEIAEIEEQALLEIKILQSIQQAISDATNNKTPEDV